MARIKTRLRILLAERNMKQYELAAKAGVSRNTVAAIFHDKWDRVSRDVILAICEALDCQPGELFVRE
jgi:putative transcriptional regulator